ncbi:unnamed protein product [Boreogadus saida]
MPRSQKPAVPESRRLAAERLEEALNHLCVPQHLQPPPPQTTSPVPCVLVGVPIPPPLCPVSWLGVPASPDHLPCALCPGGGPRTPDHLPALNPTPEATERLEAMTGGIKPMT